MSSNRKIDYVYILGASHSGTTLLAMLLNSHPEIATVGESAPGNMGNVEDYLCSCGRLILECPFWVKVTDRIREHNPDFNIDKFGTRFETSSGWLFRRALGAEHRGWFLEQMRNFVLGMSPSWRRARLDIMQSCHDLAAAVLETTGARVFVDSSKHAHRLKFLLRIPEFNIKVIHLIRDGRGVALTYMRQDEFADAKEPAMRRGGRGMESEALAQVDMGRAADEWRRCLRSAEFVLSGIDRSQWTEIRYEDMCSSPDITLSRLFEFVGADPDWAADDFRSVEHHIVGNGMRLDSTSEIRLDEQWKSVLNDKQLTTFNRVAGRINRRYGYV